MGSIGLRHISLLIDFDDPASFFGSRVSASAFMSAVLDTSLSTVTHFPYNKPNSSTTFSTVPETSQEDSLRLSPIT